MQTSLYRDSSVPVAFHCDMRGPDFAGRAFPSSGFDGSIVEEIKDLGYLSTASQEPREDGPAVEIKP